MSALAQGRADLERASTAQKVADMLRERVLDGELAPGLRLSEEAIGGALGVSRNTLREAFRLLTRDRLLVHEHSRGVFVRRPGGEDVRDLYAARRVIECGALQNWPAVGDDRRAAVRTPVEEASAHGARRDWAKVGAANIRFHRGIVGLAGSHRLSEESDRLFAELMLAFRVVSDPERLHMAYLPLNREIVELLSSGDVDGATTRLREYFDLAESDLVAQLEQR
ncbi:transcriptional regulator, GntR family [Lentzea xinjiangensis]|uniref:Transcriptional regulator, GntR family n=1 Tax=Lentzea xinjiangensis TaxID=402600 RepID=A0A1H9A812_9PSEU|nr:transcriptional regulator, GntR family [Lentzea xinjiangensis]